jgi:choline dehydrogenase-like flavoprotein
MTLPPRTQPAPSGSGKYDVIIIGAGAGGGMAALVLATASKRVLLLERGRNLSYDDIGRDHLRNHRHFPYGQNAGPEMTGNPRTIATDDAGGYRVTSPNEGAYQNNAATVGGGTRVFGAQAWRFMPQDFRMASEYGVPAGSSLADWPISYDDLAPYYERVEWEIGVCGDSAEMTHLPPFAKPFPMPTLPMTERGRINRRGAAVLGWDVVSPPLMINSVPYQDRPACIGCQHCVGFPCPVDAKNSTYSTAIPRAVATGNCDLIAVAMVERLVVDSGRVTGVRYVDSSDQRVEVSAPVVVVAGGASETPRLLLNSAHDGEPHGVGNAYDQVGRHLQGHYYPRAVGLFEQPVWDGVGPGVRTATCKFNHGNDGIIGGSMLADDFVTLPMVVWSSLLPPDLPRWGLANKRFMREGYRHLNDITGPVQEIPTPDFRVTVNREVRDRWGIPVVHFAGATHAETFRAGAFMLARAKEWLAAAGAVRVWGFPGGQPSGQHHAGTCRMGDDPRMSVVDRWGRVHGHENLYIADASVHVTNGGFNPVLTIMALAYRTAEGIVLQW